MKKMKKNRICSDRHFRSLIKSFTKKFIAYTYSLKEDNANKFLKQFQSEFHHIWWDPEGQGNFEWIMYKVLKEFKHSPFNKNKCFFTLNENWHKEDDTCYKNHYDTTIWIGYSVEDKDHKVIRNNDYQNNYIVFKVYVKIGYYKKKLVYKFPIKINWIKSENNEENKG